jgi:chromate transporter
MWIFAFAPWLERLENAPRLKGGLAAITASVVGVIANLTLWFALHVVFRRVSDVAFGPLTLTLPVPASFDWKVAVVAVLAALLIFRLRFGIIPTLAASAAAGLALSVL